MKSFFHTLHETRRYEKITAAADSADPGFQTDGANK
jgi:hypothetical protein